MQPQTPVVMTADYIATLHSMLENLTTRVDQIGTTLESITTPPHAQVTPSAPATLEISLSFLAAATGKSKSTVERRIAEAILPKPRTNPDNGYRYWYKSDLPTTLHSQIDEHYARSLTKASR